jgi:hypothetical protein
MKNQLLYLFLILGFVSCGDNVKLNNPAFEGQKDNVFWRAVDSKATLVNGNLTLEGFTSDEKLILVFPAPKTSITLNNKTSHVTYFLGTTDNRITSSFIASASTSNPPTYQTIVTPGPVNKVLISSAGAGYTDSIMGTTGGTGSGLKVKIEVNSLGAINAVSVTAPGSDYTSGDVITISGGNDKGKLIVQNVNNSSGEITITGYDGVGKIVSGTFKFNAINVNNDPLPVPTLTFQHGNFYIPVK